VLGLTATFLARECKSLLIGEPARRETQQSIRTIAEGCYGVRKVLQLITVHLAPRQVVLSLQVNFADSLGVSQLETVVQQLQKKVKQRHPEITAVFVTPSAGEQSD
jgi:divalent metal cation (Fe/Co/Zn/Cd) transporter